MRQIVLTDVGWWFCFMGRNGVQHCFGPFRWKWQAKLRGWTLKGMRHGHR